jgi:acyl-CoA reductase-like NAD-dependent aldehyde dehydrogenase
LKEYGLYVNGEWRKSATGKTFVTKNPANGEILAFFAQGNREKVGHLSIYVHPREVFTLIDFLSLRRRHIIKIYQRLKEN